jgi:vacuolar-type H+-ATPase subunit H
MDITQRLQQLEEMAMTAKSMPLSSSVLINREELLEMIQEMREALPEEIKQARWVVKDREQLLAKARRDAEGLIQQALAQQAKLVSGEEVVKEANREAERTVNEAREEARQIRHEAEDYMDQKLAAFEAAITRTMEQIAQIKEANDASFGRIRDQLARTLQQVERGRERLRGGTIAEEELAVAAPEEVP